jgi:hypothetical protein
VFRLFDPRDVLLLRRLKPQGVAFDLRRHLLQDTSPTRDAVLGYLTAHHLGAVTCVYRAPEEDGLNGFVQVSEDASGAAWDLAYLAPSLDYNLNACSTWCRMLGHLILLAAEYGVERICARSGEDAEAEDLFRRAGFTAVSREEVFALDQEAKPAPLPRGLRRAVPQDQWALDELYRQVVPKVVQQAEGCVPRWAVPQQRVVGQRSATEQYVWADKGRMLAYLRLTKTARGSWLEALTRPEQRGDVLPQLRYLLTRAAPSAQSPVYCPVPDHTVGLGWLLRTLGFESYTRQVLLVAHTIARVSARRRLMVSGLEHSIDVSRPMGHVSHSKESWPLGC